MVSFMCVYVHLRYRVCVCVCTCICVLASIYHCMMCLCYCTYVHVAPIACHSQHPIGGCVTVLQTSIPNVGPGALKYRDVSPSAIYQDCKSDNCINVISIVGDSVLILLVPVHVCTVVSYPVPSLLFNVAHRKSGIPGVRNHMSDLFV